MSTTPEELALDLSSASVRAQEQSETHLREKATADLRQMQAAAAKYLDDGYKHNQAILERAARRVGRAIVLLTVEILGLAVALLVTLVN